MRLIVYTFVCYLLVLFIFRVYRKFFPIFRFRLTIKVMLLCFEIRFAYSYNFSSLSSFFAEIEISISG